MNSEQSAGDVDRSGKGSGRSCHCGWKGETAQPECPDCGQEWFIDPVTGEVNGFA